jgi:hypothetical protein
MQIEMQIAVPAVIVRPPVAAMLIWYELIKKVLVLSKT